jgi:predicted small secreted protein
MSAQRAILLVALCVALAACGAGRAVSTTGQAFDRFGCLARDFKKGAVPCPSEHATAPQAQAQ